MPPRRHADLIGQTGRDALVELRHLFGAVHHGQGGDLDGPPGLGRLPTLVERARAAGLPVTLRTEGDPVELAPGLDIAAYRIIQEALTNTYKHAGRAEATVTVTHWEHLVMLEVVDDGRGPGGDAGDTALQRRARSGGHARTRGGLRGLGPGRAPPGRRVPRGGPPAHRTRKGGRMTQRWQSASCWPTTSPWSAPGSA